MALLSGYGRQIGLNWLLGGAAATRPAAQYMGLSYGAPSSTSGSEVVTPAGTYTRVTFSAAAAASPGGSASNAAAVVFPVCTYTATISGWQMWDQLAVAGGNFYMYGLLSAATNPANSQFTAAVGSVIITAN